VWWSGVARGWTDKVPETNRKAVRKHVVSAANPTGVVVGIDAGGSSTWARAVDRGVVVHEGVGYWRQLMQPALQVGTTFVSGAQPGGDVFGFGVTGGKH
jgi:hypothetical protein